MADHQIVSEEALTAIASDIKTDIRAKADSSNVYTKSATDTLLEGKANTEGEYDGLTVGNAKQLVATVGEVDKVPYLFRTAGGAIDIGDRETDELVGGSVAFNQLVPILPASQSKTENGVTITDNRDGSYTVITTPEGATATTFLGLTNIPNGRALHKYFIGGCAKGGSLSTYYVGGRYIWQVSGKIDSGNGAVIEDYQPQYSDSFGIMVKEGTIITTALIFKPQLIDLTQMFGATIADYIYSLEQATAGAGVAWFRKLFPKSYYSYNAGQIMSVKTSKHITTGFNQFDVQNADLRQTGFDGGATSPYNVTTFEHTQIVPETVYCWTDSLTADGRYLRFYDFAGNVIETRSIYNAPPFTFTTPAGAASVRLMWLANAGITVDDVSNNGKVCINISWDGERDGEYEPYEVNTYPLDSDLELRGIPKLDADNKLYYDGDEYESTGDVTRKYGIVDLGSLNWNADSNRAGVFYTNGIASLIKQPVPNASAQILASKFYTMRNASVPAADSLADADKTISSYPSYGGGYIFVVDLSHASDDAATFKTAMSGVYLVYELATPTTEQAEPYTNPQIVNDFGTEEYIDDRAVAIPVGHNTFYEVNLRAKLEMSPDSPESNGDYLMRHTSEGNAYTPYVSPIPSLPSADGNYVLKCTVSGSTKTLTWVEET